MNRFLSPPTSAALSCERSQSGLLGGGYRPFAGESASSFYMPLQNFAGTYETDDYSAALYIVNLLLSKDAELSPEEYPPAEPSFTVNLLTVSLRTSHRLAQV